MKKIISCVLFLLFVFSFTVAFASVRLPDNRGIVTDDANVLSGSMVKAMETVSNAVDKACGIRLYVAMVHFLDGTMPEQYAKILFERWNLDDNAVLVLGAAGEDACAVCLGEKAAAALGKSNVENLLLTSGFEEKFEVCAYDEAVATLLLNYGELCSRQTGREVNVKKLLPSDLVPETVQNTASGAQNGFNATRPSNQNHRNMDEEDGSDGLSFGEWFLIALLILIVFSQSNPVLKARRTRREPYKRYGCGCSPIGWIFSLIGITGIIDFLRSRNQ